MTKKARIRAVEEAAVSLRMLAKRRPDIAAVCEIAVDLLLSKRAVILCDPLRTDDRFALHVAAEIHAQSETTATQPSGMA